MGKSAENLGASPFNRDLSTDITFSRIHLAAQSLLKYIKITSWHLVVGHKSEIICMQLLEKYLFLIFVPYNFWKHKPGSTMCFPYLRLAYSVQKNYFIHSILNGIVQQDNKGQK